MLGYSNQFLIYTLLRFCQKYALFFRVVSKQALFIGCLGGLLVGVSHVGATQPGSSLSESETRLVKKLPRNITIRKYSDEGEVDLQQEIQPQLPKNYAIEKITVQLEDSRKSEKTLTQSYKLDLARFNAPDDPYYAVGKIYVFDAAAPMSSRMLETINLSLEVYLATIRPDQPNLRLDGSGTVEIYDANGRELPSKTKETPESDQHLTYTVCSGYEIMVKIPVKDWSISTGKYRGMSFNWYQQVQDGTEVNLKKNVKAAQVNVTPDRTTTYSVEVLDKKKEHKSKRTYVTVNVIPSIAAAEVDDLSICQGDNLRWVPKAPTAIANPRFVWYTAVTPTSLQVLSKTPLWTNSINPDGSFKTATAPVGTHTFYVGVYSASCTQSASPREGDLKEVKLTVKPRAKASDIPVEDPPSLCVGDNGRLGPSSQSTNNVYTWYRNATTDERLTLPEGSTIDVKTGISIKNIPSGTHTYYVSIHSSDLCENSPGDRKAISIHVKDKAPQPQLTSTSISVCEGEEVDLVAQTGAASKNQLGAAIQYHFYPNSTGIGQELAPLPSGKYRLPHGSGGPYPYSVRTIGPNLCLSDPVPFNVTVHERPSLPPPIVWKDNIDACLGETINLFKALGIDFTSELLQRMGLNQASNYAFYNHRNERIRDPERYSVPTTPGNYKYTLANIKTYGSAEETIICTSSLRFNFMLRVQDKSRLVKGLEVMINFMRSPQGLNKSDFESLLDPATSVLSPASIAFNAYGLLKSQLSSKELVPIIPVCQGTAQTLQQVASIANLVERIRQLIPSNILEMFNSSLGKLVENHALPQFYDQKTGKEVNVIDPTLNYFLRLRVDGYPIDIPFRLHVLPYATDKDISNLQDQTICEGDGLTLRPSSHTVTNPLFKWHRQADLTDKPITGPDSIPIQDLSLSTLEAGTHTYYVTVEGDTHCQNRPHTGKAVKITVKPTIRVDEVVDQFDAAPKELCEGDTRMTLMPKWKSTDRQYALAWYVSDKSSRTSTVNVVRQILPGKGQLFGEQMVDCKIDANADLTVTGQQGAAFQPGQYEFYIGLKGDATYCDTKSDTRLLYEAFVNIKPRAVAGDITAPNQSICLGETATLTASSATVKEPAFTWYSNAALTEEVAKGASYTTPSLTASAKYYIRVSGENRCENAAGNGKEVRVTVHPKPQPPTLDQSHVTICQGDNQTADITKVVNNYDPGKHQFFDANNSLVDPAKISAAGAYTVVSTETFSGGHTCISDPVTITVSIHPKPSNPSTQDILVCKGTATVNLENALKVKDINSQYEYLFYGHPSPEPKSVPLSGPSHHILSADGPYTYSVVVKDKGTGCASNPASFTITVKEPPILAITNPEQLLCEGTEVDLTSYVNGYDATKYKYIFTAPDGRELPGPDYKVRQAGNYKLTAEDKMIPGCLSSPGYITVNLHEKPTVHPINFTAYFVHGYIDLMEAIKTTKPEYCYEFFERLTDPDPIKNLELQGSGHYEIIIGEPGKRTFYVQVTDQYDCPSDREQFEVTIERYPGNYQKLLYICPGAAVEITGFPKLPKNLPVTWYTLEPGTKNSYQVLDKKEEPTWNESTESYNTPALSQDRDYYLNIQTRDLLGRYQYVYQPDDMPHFATVKILQSPGTPQVIHDTGPVNKDQLLAFCLGDPSPQLKIGNPPAPGHTDAGKLNYDWSYSEDGVNWHVFKKHIKELFIELPLSQLGVEKTYNFRVEANRDSEVCTYQDNFLDFKVHIHDKPMVHTKTLEICLGEGKVNLEDAIANKATLTDNTKYIYFAASDKEVKNPVQLVPTADDYPYAVQAIKTLANGKICTSDKVPFVLKVHANPEITFKDPHTKLLRVCSVDKTVNLEDVLQSTVPAYTYQFYDHHHNLIRHPQTISVPVIGDHEYYIQASETLVNGTTCLSVKEPFTVQVYGGPNIAIPPASFCVGQRVHLDIIAEVDLTQDQDAYDYELYEVASPGPADKAMADPYIVPADKVSGSPHTYSLVAIEKSTNCRFDPVPFAFTAHALPKQPKPKNCIVKAGAQVNLEDPDKTGLGTAPSGLVYDFYDTADPFASGTPEPLANPYIVPNYKEGSVHTYSVVLRNTVTNCASVPASFTLTVRAEQDKPAAPDTTLQISRMAVDKPGTVYLKVSLPEGQLANAPIDVDLAVGFNTSMHPDWYELPKNRVRIATGDNFATFKVKVKEIVENDQDQVLQLIGTTSDYKVLPGRVYLYCRKFCVHELIAFGKTSLKIMNIDGYHNKVTVFTRQNEVVYEQLDYQNDHSNSFNGIGNFGKHTGLALERGNYHYKIEIYSKKIQNYAETDHTMHLEAPTTILSGTLFLETHPED